MKNRDFTICVTNDGLFVWDTRGYFHSLKTKLRFVKWHNELGLKPMARLKQRRKCKPNSRKFSIWKNACLCIENWRFHKLKNNYRVNEYKLFK